MTKNTGLILGLATLLLVPAIWASLIVASARSTERVDPNIAPSDVYEEKSSPLGRAVTKSEMSAKMTEASTTAKDPDSDFAAMMIVHHRSAIEMAKAQILNGKDPVLRRLAQEIIVTQSAEIDVLNSRLEAFAAQCR